MKKLSELYNIADDRLITGIKINSKEVEKGDIFVCTMGVTADRHDFIDEAIKNGASAIVVSKDIKNKEVPIIKVENTNLELRRLCAAFYDYPYKQAFLIATTGTNGKTTIAEIIYQLLGKNCAYLGTNGRKYLDKTLPMRNTCPDVDRLYKYFKEFVDNGCKTISMEASSEAFYRHRLDDLKFDIAILANITEDHLNIHKTLENYVNCKLQLFKQVKEDGYSILNSSDQYFELFKENAKGQILTYGFKESDTLYIKDYTLHDNKTEITYIYKQKEYQVISPLLGLFNISNLSAAILACLAKNISFPDLILKISKLNQIEGRVELLPFTTKYTIVLDYAHTKDALDNLLTFFNSVKKNRIITVTGSAGGREKGKRPSMGKVVLDKSDYVIFTMDDPRDEDVNQIIDDLVSTSSKTNYERIIDRKEAIYKALSIAEDNDIVLIAGKGRDNYMALGHEYIPYCDYDVIKSYFD
mgnify:FL=1